MMRKVKLSLGPTFFNWPPEKWRDFYFRIADEAPLDTVHLGEVVCSKRLPLIEAVIPEVVERLEAAGKEVVVSTLALIMSKREMNIVRELAASGDIMTEANDVSTAALLTGRPHVIGPFVNIYNEGTLAWFVGNGAVRVCLPVELSGIAISKLIAASEGAKPELEVIAFGRLPLAVSARCYHARANGLHKDNCAYVCDQDPDGMELETLDGAPFLTVNGTQTLSHSCCNLIGDLATLAGAGIRRLRLSPQDADMVAVASIFRDVLDGNLDLVTAERRLSGLVGGMAFSNGFFHGIEGARKAGPLAAAE